MGESSRLEKELCLNQPRKIVSGVLPIRQAPIHYNLASTLISQPQTENWKPRILKRFLEPGRRERTATNMSTHGPRSLKLAV